MKMVRKVGLGYTQVACFGELGLRVPIRIDVSDTATAAKLEAIGDGTGNMLLRAGTPLGNATENILDTPNSIQTFVNGVTTQVLLAHDLVVYPEVEEINASGVVEGVVYENKLPVAIEAEAKTALKDCVFRTIRDNG
jgi:hypothetical protein